MLGQDQQFIPDKAVLQTLFKQAQKKGRIHIFFDVDGVLIGNFKGRNPESMVRMATEDAWNEHKEQKLNPEIIAMLQSLQKMGIKISIDFASAASLNDKYIWKKSIEFNGIQYDENSICSINYNISPNDSRVRKLLEYTHNKTMCHVVKKDGLYSLSTLSKSSNGMYEDQPIPNSHIWPKSANEDVTKKAFITHRMNNIDSEIPCVYIDNDGRHVETLVGKFDNLFCLRPNSYTAPNGCTQHNIQLSANMQDDYSINTTFQTMAKEAKIAKQNMAENDNAISDLKYLFKTEESTVQPAPYHPRLPSTSISTRESSSNLIMSGTPEEVSAERCPCLPWLARLFRCNRQSESTNSIQLQ